MACAIPKAATNILSHCRIGPPSEVAAEHFPLTWLDVPWVYSRPAPYLLFYQVPCSKAHFLLTIVPILKKSLSQTLKHYVPLAGNLIIPPNSSIPGIQFRHGDSVPVTIAESNEASNFIYLTGDKPRDADEFYALIPAESDFIPVPDPESELGSRKVHLLAVQITLFPEKGICVGFAIHHATGDASSHFRFVNAWSSIAKLGVEECDVEDFLAAKDLLPFLGRGLLEESNRRLRDLYWNPGSGSPPPSLFLPKNRVRATFTLNQNQIISLRNSVLSRNPNLTYLSSFTIATSYVWTCLAKSTSAQEVVDDHVAEFFHIWVDIRARMDPPIPAAYFGNCLIPKFVGSTHGELKRDDGFVRSVELIGEVIRNEINNKQVDILEDAEEIVEKCATVFQNRVSSVSGSPKFSFYGMDFGWGNPYKFEALAIDFGPNMSLSKSREFEGALEIGLCLPNKQMDAFAVIFSHGLEI